MTMKFFIVAVFAKGGDEYGREVFMERYFDTFDEALDFSRKYIKRNQYYTGDYAIMQRIMDEPSFYMNDVSVYECNYNESVGFPETLNYCIEVNMKSKESILRTLSNPDINPEVSKHLNVRLTELNGNIENLRKMLSKS